MSECACAHTKIKEISWNENHATSSKFMCLDCNTDFVQLTPEIRDFLWRKKHMTVSYPDDYNGLDGFDPTAYK